MTRFGRLWITEDNGAITRVTWTGPAQSRTASALLQEACAQIAAYDAGELQQFDLPLHVVGSAFQRAVCDQIYAIAYGDTCTYGDIAKTLGVPAQAVGQACGGNPIPIIIPCHRVMGARGLTGFSGGAGVETKVQLLVHEKAAGLLI